MTDNMTISVIIPAYKEAEGVGEVVRRVRALPGAETWEIIVVDDGSPDGTAQAAEAAGARVVRHTYNLGNGASVKSGGLAASGDVLVFLDADGQHPPEEIPRLLALMPEYDMVVGARTRDSDVSRFRRLGNTALIALAQFLLGRKVGDLTSGFRAVKRERFLDYVHLFPQRYSYPTTITMALFSAGHFVAYVPMDSIRRRQTGQSDIKPFKDGLRFINIMLRMIMLFNPLKVMLPASAVIFLTGLTMGTYDVLVKNKLQQADLLCLLLGSLLFFFGYLADQVAQIRRDLHSLIKNALRDR